MEVMGSGVASLAFGFWLRSSFFFYFLFSIQQFNNSTTLHTKH